MPLANMEDLTLRRVYTTLTTPAGITEDPLDTAAIETYIEGLVVNPEVSQYDWSGTSVFTYKLSEKNLSESIPATLISDTHALASDHNGPQVNGTCYWRTPAGGMASAVVAERQEIAGTGGELRLVRFSTNPGATLKRYSICTNASLAAFTSGPLWLLDQDQEIRLRYLSSVDSTRAYHSVSSWSNSQSILTGSGRPAFVATSDNDLIFTGTLATSSSNTRISAVISTLQGILDGYSETLTTAALPGPGEFAVVGEGVRRRVAAGVVHSVQPGVRGIY